MAITLVTSGTGHLGRDPVLQLLSRRHSVRVLARTPGRDSNVQWAKGDLVTGEGLRDALDGVQTVIHAATLSPIARRGSIRLTDFFATPASVDVHGTLRLLEPAERAKVAHFLHVSIVGLDDSPLPYSRVKLAGERLVRHSRLSWSVVRAAPFYYLLDRILENLRWLPVWPLPDAPFDPVDTSDVAAHLAECAGDGKRGVREEIGGPDTLSFVELARQYQNARSFRRRILALRPSAIRARTMGFVPASGRRGRKTWRTWLSEHPLAAASSHVHATESR
jgi:uncharacterized protein YbjT (DUF2867 family)